jgi:uncharacterized protein (DUF1697 family)
LVARAAAAASDRHVALLRGINLGKRQIPMKDLCAMFERAGCTHVRSFIASGNVVFTAPPGLAARIPKLVAGAIEEAFGFDAPIVLRSGAQMRTVARRHPHAGTGVKPGYLYVGFLASVPPRARVAALDPNRSPPDVFEVRGQEIYACYPKGSARSKLTNAWFDAELRTLSTFRNWNTVTALAEMALE